MGVEVMVEGEVKGDEGDAGRSFAAHRASLDEQLRRFPHHRLDAYLFSLEVAVQAKDLSDKVPRGYRTVADQLLRAGTSTVLLIAEGANRYTAGQKRQRFMEARGGGGALG